MSFPDVQFHSPALTATITRLQFNGSTFDNDYKRE